MLKVGSLQWLGPKKGFSLNWSSHISEITTVKIVFQCIFLEFCAKANFVSRNVQKDSNNSVCSRKALTNNLLVVFYTIARRLILYLIT
jgi:hypothetical protein